MGTEHGRPGRGAQFLASYRYAGWPSRVWDLTASWSEAGVGRWLHRHVRLAGFFDIGATALSTDRRAVRTGLGVGVRLTFGPVTVRADWGHRTPDVIDGTLRGDLFLSVRPNLSLGVFE